MWSDDLDEKYDDEPDDEDRDGVHDQDDRIGETVPCPACGREVYEDADQCPACGEWIIPLGNRRATWPRVVSVVLIGALLFGVLAGLLRWFR